MRKKLILVTMILALFISACAKQNIEEESGKIVSNGKINEENEIRWTIEETKLPNADEALVDCIPQGGSYHEDITGMVKDNIYRVVTLRDKDLGAQGICIQKLESPYQEWKNYTILKDEWIEDKYCYVMKEAINEDESICFLLQGLDDENNWYYYIAKWTENEALTIREVPDEYSNAEFFENIKQLYKDNEESLYLVTAGGIQCYGADFSKGKEWINAGYVWQITENYICGGSSEGNFRIWNIDSSNPLFSADNVWMNYTDKVSFMNETEGILGNVEGIWQFSLDNGEIRQLMSFYDYGYSIDKICGVNIGENDNIRVAVIVDGQYMFIDRVEDIYVKDKVELEYATCFVTPFLREAIVDYNKQSHDCHIILRELGPDENRNDFKTRIQAEISSGNGPALLDYTIMDLKNGYEKGFLRDLSDSFTKQRNGMLENVKVSGETEKGVYAIPYCFSVQSLVVFEDMVGEQNNWNVEKMIQCANEEGVEAAISCYEGSQLFYLLTMGSGINEKLIELEDNKCYLDSEYAVSILEFAKQYSDEANWDEWAIRIRERKVLSYLGSVASLSPAQSIQEVFQGKETYIGFPIENGKNGSIISTDLISINQACEYPEQAISFIEYLLNEENQEKLGKAACSESASSGFPVSAKAIDDMFGYADEEQEKNPTIHNMESTGGVEYTSEPLTAEGLEKIRELLLNAQVPKEGDLAQISDIMEEETHAFFVGDKSAEEVCAVLQNRVQLYLEER